MKKMTTVLAAAALLFTSTAFATEGPEESAKVKAAFAKTFANATEVSWESRDGFYFATFQVNHLRVDVAYNADGELVATSRQIAFNQLPLNVSMKLNEAYAGYSFGQSVTEMSFEGQTSYYIYAGNSKQVVTLKATADGSISTEKKTKL